MCRRAWGAAPSSPTCFPDPSWRPENSRWIATRRCRAGASARCARRWPRVCNGALSRPACRSCACSRYRPGTGCRRAWRRVEPERLSYATGHGDAGLREAIADYLRGTRGIACTPAQVVITSGTQQSLHLVAQLLADPGDRVWLEDRVIGARASFMPPAWRAWRWRSTARAWRQAPRNGPSRRGWRSCRRRTNIPPART